MTKSAEIYVFIQINNQNIQVGKLWHHYNNQKESTSFEYSQNWLSHPYKFALEPALKLTSGTFHNPKNQVIFGSIGDSAPDRWGRVLMRRANFNKYQSQNKTPPSLNQLDYLLQVNDLARQGALRFSKTIDGAFLTTYQTNPIPPIIKLEELLNASQKFIDNNQNDQELQLLLAPGSSLGGARPKASIYDNNQNLAIAKFYNQNDEYNTILWEACALTLAKKAKINTPNWQIINIKNKPILVLQRFDRIKQQRIPFLSAMSMLNASDNEEHSYLEIAYNIMQQGYDIENDLAQLFRRLIFNILISNTDDHLRNHGFLFSNQQGWSLSPAYDLNPTPTWIKPRILSTNINLDNADASIDLALSIAGEFRLNKNQAIKIIKEVAESTNQYKQVAKNLNISKSEISQFSSAFEHQDLQKALNL